MKNKRISKYNDQFTIIIAIYSSWIYCNNDGLLCIIKEGKWQEFISF